MTNSRLKRYKPLKRSAPPRKKRPGVRRGQPTNAEKEAERDRVYARCGGRCELDLMPTCWKGVIPKNGSTPWDHWHLVHLHSKRRFGWTEAQGNTLLGGCPACHLEGIHRLGLKPKQLP